MNSFYQNARFLAAAARLEQAPADQGREVAFAGRSNAGKSSAINALCHQKTLARASKTPGRTQQLIFFQLDVERRLVDLPGYGYAQVAETVKLQWQRQLADYLERRRALAGLVLAMDIRHPLAGFDRQLLHWVGERADLRVLILLTKADKLGRSGVVAACRTVETAIAPWGLNARVIDFSATRHTGVTAVQELLDRWLERPALAPAAPDPGTPQ